MIGRASIGRRRVAGAALVLVGLVLSLGRTPTSLDDTLRYGVSRTAAGASLAIHWVLCPGDAPRTVDVGEDVGGSRTAAGVPIFWQIRSDRPANQAMTVETYVVGETPTGFYETIPLWTPLPTAPEDLLSISSPPGDATSTAGMGFALQDLPSSGIYRGDYQAVSDEQFAHDGANACGMTAPAAPLPGLGFVLLLGAVVIGTTASRRAVLIVAALVVGAAAVTLVSQRARLELAAGVREDSAAFAPGPATMPSGRTVLADLRPESPSVHEVTDGLFVARFLAPGDYAFVVGCSGRSLQVGESSEIPNGGTGSRQLIGCSSPLPVCSGIGARPDRARLVEVVMFTNGATDWHVVVVEGPGDVGPFDQP